ncbi:MAG TPA: dTDP-4-dehydrorhamnose 3,5-epimerase [Streptosporangiaceae bacterium]|jgi:dTDP-4-dehydrorhamnose 3,5-epimerase
MFGAQWLGIGDAVVFTPAIQADERGEVCELFSTVGLTAAVGHALAVTQATCTSSRRGAMRGIYFTRVPSGQATLVSCLSGAVLHAVLDLSPGSPSFGSAELVRLDGRTRQALYLPDGLGHGYLVLSDHAIVVHLRGPEQPDVSPGTIHPLDPGLGIAWPPGIEPVLSAEDAAAPTLEQARTAGLLPGRLPGTGRRREPCGGAGGRPADQAAP